MWVRLCSDKNKTLCNDKNECLNRCDVHLIETEEDEADDNTDDDTVPDRGVDIVTGIKILLNDDLDDDNMTTLEVNDEKTTQGDDDDDHYDDGSEEIQTQQSDTNLSDRSLANSSETVVALHLSLGESENLGKNKNSVSNVSQSTGGDGIINKIWMLVKAVLNAVEIFWFRMTGTK